MEKKLKAYYAAATEVMKVFLKTYTFEPPFSEEKVWRDIYIHNSGTTDIHIPVSDMIQYMECGYSKSEIFAYIQKNRTRYKHNMAKIPIPRYKFLKQ